MKKIAAFIVKYRWIMTGIFVALVAVCAVFITRVHTNYNIIKYLDEESETVVALEKMESEFGAVGSANVMIKNVESEADALAIKKKIKSIEGVANVLFEVEADESKHETVYYKPDEQKALYVIFLHDGNFEPEGHATVQRIRSVLSGYDLVMSGQSVDSIYLQDAVKDDMIIILGIAIAVIFLILLLTSASWVDPVIFGIIVAGAILINLGTNALLAEISFITKSICAVMQLALAMDYSIMLLHRYNEELETIPDRKEALTSALAKTFAPVSASSLTTMAGLVALMFMSFTLGFDVGLVLAKGILVSVLTVFLFMPGILLLFAPLLEKTKHPSLHSLLKARSEKHSARVASEKGSGVKVHRIRSFADFQFKTRIIIPVIAVCLIVAGVITQSFVKYDYKLETAKDKTDPVITEKAEITDSFGHQNSLVVMIPRGDTQKEIELTQAMLALKSGDKNVVTGGLGMASKMLRTKLSAGQISAIYGLSEAVIEQAIDAYYAQQSAQLPEGEQKTILLGELLDFLCSPVPGAENTTCFDSIVAGVQSAANAGAEQAAQAAEAAAPLFGSYPSANAAALLGSLLSTAEQPVTVPSAATDGVYAAAQKDPADVWAFNEFIAFAAANNAFASSPALQAGVNEVYANIQKLSPLTADQLTGETDMPGEITAAIFQRIQPLFESCNPAKTAFMLTNLLGASVPADAITPVYAAAGKQTWAFNEFVIFAAQNNVYEATNPTLQAGINAVYGSLPYSADRMTIATYLGLVKQNNALIQYGEQVKPKLAEARETVNEAAATFDTQRYTRIMFNVDLPIAEDESFEFMQAVRKLAKEYYDECYIICESASFLDIRDTFNSDMVKVNLISFFAVLLIILLTYRSIGIPALLTLFIQGAIWISAGMSALSSSTVFFVCSLVVMCIQMGATIDYAILLTGRYVECRKTSGKRESIKDAFDSSIITILSSGAILVLASFIIGLVSNVDLISELGMLLARGCLVSVLMVIFALPQVLLLCDKILEKTTLKCKFFNEKAALAASTGADEQQAEPEERPTADGQTTCDEPGTEQAAEDTAAGDVEQPKGEAEQ